jgi:hypothetical protein
MASFFCVDGYREGGPLDALTGDLLVAATRKKVAVPQSSLALQRALLEQSIAEQRSKIAGLDQSLLRKRADAESTRHLLEKLK